VFSNPAPGSDAEYEARNNPRYWMQQIRQNLAASRGDGALSPAADLDTSIASSALAGRRAKVSRRLKKDWSFTLGGSG
jgi:hypothetical protein